MSVMGNAPSLSREPIYRTHYPKKGMLLNIKESILKPEDVYQLIERQCKTDI